MPRSFRTLAPRWLAGGGAALALAAVALAATGSDVPLFLAVNAAADRHLPAWLPSELTVLGNGLVAVMLVAPFLRREPQVVAIALFAVLPAALFSRLGKVLANRPRPAALLPLQDFHVQGPVLAGSNSFPSGHSITIFVVVSAIVLGSDRLRAQPAAALALAGAGLLAASSRVMVGAHWPSDVLGGAALGIWAGTAGAWACGRWPLWRFARGPQLMAFAIVGVAALLPWIDTGYPLAQPVQWAAALLGLACAVRELAPGPRGRAGS
jgi:undecaprenyl-diphosphatase